MCYDYAVSPTLFVQLPIYVTCNELYGKMYSPNCSIKNKISVLAWHGRHYYKDGVLQNTRFPQCTIIKTYK